MGGFLLKLQKFKKVKVIFWHPVLFLCIILTYTYVKQQHHNSATQYLTDINTRSWSIIFQIFYSQPVGPFDLEGMLLFKNETYSGNVKRWYLSCDSSTVIGKKM